MPGIITEGAGSAAPSPALSAPLWRGIVTRCGEDVARMIEALRIAQDEALHPRDASYAPERYAERGGVTVDAALALLAPLFVAALIIALAVVAS